MPDVNDNDKEDLLDMPEKLDEGATEGPLPHLTIRKGYMYVIYRRDICESHNVIYLTYI